MRICLNKFLIFFEPYDDEVILRALNRYPRAGDHTVYQERDALFVNAN